MSADIALKGMSPHPAASSLKSRPSTATDLGRPTTPQLATSRWLIEHRVRPLTGFNLREEIDAAVHTRTGELELEIAALRQDIDRRRASEREQAAARAAAEARCAAMTSWLAMMSRKLSTPIEGVAHAADQLHATVIDPKQTRLLQTIAESGRQLRAAIGDLRDFSTLEAGQLALEAIDFDLAEELQLAMDLRSEAAAARGLGIIADIDPAVPARVRGDPARLRQILVHLLDNAIKFTPAGEVALRVRAEPSSSGRTRVRVEVTDTGVGLSSEQRTALFRPFTAFPENAAAPSAAGLGLGLVICKGLVAAMNGEIGAIGTEDGGSTFWFTVELDDAREPAADPQSGLDHLAGRHVLIVDDNATNRKLFGRLAATWEMRPGDADSPSAALAYLRESARTGNRVDIVLLDHDRVCSDGLQLARAIRADATIPPPVLAMLTPRALVPTRMELDAHGIALCEQKPVHPKKLRAMLARALRAKA